MRELENKVAQLIENNIGGSIDVRVGEQLASIPKDEVIVVNLDQKRQKTNAFIDVFENIFKIQLKMHYADKSEADMKSMADAVQYALLNLNAWTDDDSVLHFQITETKKQIIDQYWTEEFTYMVLAVDKES